MTTYKTMKNVFSVNPSADSSLLQFLRRLPAIVLAGRLVLPNLAGASDTLHIEPSRALPDYAKLSLAKGTSFDDELYPVFALGDFNEDGRLDVAITGGVRPPVPPYGVRIYLQRADDTLQKNIDYMIPNTDFTWEFFSADLNGDGHLDLLLEDLGNDLIMLLGNGNGTFREPQFLGLSAPAFPVAAHLNGDRHLDLVSGSLDGTVVVFAGAGTFTPQATLNTVIKSLPPKEWTDHGGRSEP